MMTAVITSITPSQDSVWSMGRKWEGLLPVLLFSSGWEIFPRSSQQASFQVSLTRGSCARSWESRSLAFGSVVQSTVRKTGRKHLLAVCGKRLARRSYPPGGAVDVNIVCSAEGESSEDGECRDGVSREASGQREGRDFRRWTTAWGDT